MIKILAGIPSKLRSTSGAIADILSESCSEVIVVSQGAKVYCHDEKVHVIEKPVDYGLIPARNFILKYAIDRGFDYVIECDDDIKFDSEVPELMINTLIKYPTLGAISSSSRAYFNWDDHLNPTKPFVLSPCPSQFWAISVPLVNEIGPMMIDYLEDREYGARLWKNGRACVSLHVSIEYAHNQFIYRTSKSESDGGQLNEDYRYDKLAEAIDEFLSYHGDICKITQAKRNAKGRTFSSRYDWNRMLKFVTDKYGFALDYDDSRGRRL